MVRRSAPPSSRWVANEWRSVCGETPPCSAARRVWSPSRRRTSEVDRRRPVFDRNRACSASPLPRERRPRALQIALERPPGRFAGGDHARPAPLALHAHLLCIGIDGLHVQVHQLLCPEPGGVRELEQRAVAQLQRPGRGDALQQLGHLAAAQDARKVRIAPRRGHQVARVGRERAAFHEVAVEGADRRKLAANGGARGAALGEHAGEAAQLAVAQLAGLDPLGARPLRELSQIHPVCAARALAHPAGALPGVEAAQGGGPTSLCGSGIVLRQHAGRTGGDAHSAR